MTSAEELVTPFNRLALADDPSASATPAFSSEETGSSMVDPGTLPSLSLRRVALNHFLTSCGKDISIPTLGRNMKPFIDLSKAAKNTYVQRATTTIVSTLEVIAPSDPTALWQSVQTTRSVDKAFGLNASPAEQKYLEALAESYHQAETWDAKRQILAVMADLASFKQMQMFFPTLSEYKFKVARLHILLHGRGAPVPRNRSPRMRVNERALDHFLTFITSSHIIQDLPFGEKHLKLSCGTIIETPNVIRSIIPSRIVEQYLSHCKEEGVTPMSKSTMLRILDACKATVRKSLQGLDYIAAEGAKAFDDLVDVVNKLEGVKGVEWSSDSKHMLKKGKQYLKSDYKVNIRRGALLHPHLL